MDYQNLQNQVVLYKSLHTAYRTQRLPTLSFNSYYGTSTVNGLGTHGNFSAVGTLSFPLFREARLRGDEDASQAQLDAVNAQLADLRNHIDEQIRAALLDVNANKQLVDVSRSNVDLATYALSDETDRVNAGVDDNLPLVTAQARWLRPKATWSRACTSTTCRSSCWRERRACWSSSTGCIWGSEDRFQAPDDAKT